MSYLGFPRIHFAGAFFSNPANLNNLIDNYANATEGQPLVYDTGTYNNPNGVAQFYLQDCKVTQIIGTDAKEVAGDPLLGAAVDTVNPTDRQQAPDGSNYILAKMADVDTDMQFRSELYGLRLFVKTADGYGFEGRIDCPQLRDLFFARGNAGINGMQVASGTWHQRMTVEKWYNPEPKASTIINLLSDNNNMILDVKLSVDMFQCDPGTEFSVGNRYLYGRLMATIGLVEANAPKQIVPGRRLYSPASFASLQTASSAQSEPLILTKQEAEVAAQSSAITDSGRLWSNCDAKVASASDGNTYLLVDLGPTTRLLSDGTGAFDTGSIELGYLDSSDNFTAFATQGYMQNNSLVSVTEQLTTYTELTGANQYRDSVYLTNAGVVQVLLSANEARTIASSRLCIASDGEAALRENQGGYYINFEMAAIRMSPSSTLPDDNQTVAMTVYAYGEPVTAINGSGQLNVTLQPTVLQYSAGIDGSTQYNDTAIYGVVVSERTDNPGQFAMQVRTGVGLPFASKPTNLTEYNSWKRKPLDSQLCFILAQSNGVLVGENPGISGFPFIPPVTLLFWQNQWVVSDPDWDNNIYPILNCYSILYPGMTSRMDISDQETVESNAKGFSERFGLSTSDPAFMPVVRDMSPQTITMMQTWLSQFYTPTEEDA